MYKQTEEQDKKIRLIEQRAEEGGKKGMEDKPTEAESAEEEEGIK